MRSNNIIVLHFADTNNPVVVDIDNICAMYKTDIGDVTTTTLYIDDVTTTTLYVGSWLITVKETMGTIIQKIKTVETYKNKED